MAWLPFGVLLKFSSLLAVLCPRWLRPLLACFLINGLPLIYMPSNATAIWLVVSRVACSSVDTLAARPPISLLSICQMRPGVWAQLLAKHEHESKVAPLHELINVRLRPYSIQLLSGAQQGTEHLPPHSECQPTSLSPPALSLRWYSMRVHV